MITGRLCNSCGHLHLEEQCSIRGCNCEIRFPSVENPVDHPTHYGGDTTYEHVKVVRAWGLGYALGNATKYICRAGKKDPAKQIEDLEKAIWYIQNEINELKKTNAG